MKIKKTYNPLTLSRDYQLFENKGLTPNQFIEQENIIFTRPVILLINGQPVLRVNWNIRLKQTDICHFVELPRGGGDSNPLQMIAMIALIVVAPYAGGLVGGGLFGAIVQGAIVIGGSYLINSFFAESLPISTQLADQKQPIDVYNLNSLRNTIRIGQPFVEHFGRFSSFPDLVMSPYTRYIDNEQYLYLIGIIGVGEYEIENIYIGGALTDNFNGIEHNIIPPSGTPTICPSIIYTNMVGLEISENWLSAIATPPGVKAHKFEFDIVCPSGLHVIDSNTGSIDAVEVEIAMKYREINEDGDNLTDWIDFFTKVYSASTRDPIRHTIEKIVLEGNGRYEFKFKRNSIKSTDPLVTDTIFFEALRAFGPVHPDYGDVTLIEMSLLATDQLNNNMANQVSVVCERKLYPVTATGFGPTKTVSRSIVDACAYIITADNGGKQPDTILEFESLYDLGVILSDRDNYFDHRFLNKTSVMNACNDIARCGRSVPYTPGGLFALVRDKVQTIPAQIYTDDDYTENTLTLDHVIRTDDDATCVELQYIDPETWQTETIQYFEAGGNNEKPAKLTLIGCTSRQHAYEEAAYLYKSDDLIRTNVFFTTGLKGNIPKLGDLIYVASRHIDWAQTGQIAHISSTVATLSEPVDFGTTATEGKMLLTKKDGGVLGPYTVEPGDCAHSVKVSLSSADVNTIHAQGLTATKFIFGVTLEEILKIKILKILPSNNNEVRITGSILNNDVHDDPGTVPPLIIIQPDEEEIIIVPDPTDGNGYVYGGYGHPTQVGHELQDCDKYTPPDTWFEMTPMPAPARNSLAGTTIGSCGYVYGGKSMINYIIYSYADCDQFAPNVWASKTNMPAPTRSGLSASTIGGSSYTYGGWSHSSGIGTPDCDRYTPDTWSSMTSMPGSDPRDSTAASTIGNSGYVYGGWEQVIETELRNCTRYTPDTWTEMTYMMDPWRSWLTAATIGSSGYIFGGHGFVIIADYLVDCDEYTPDTWTSKADMLAKRGGSSASAIGDSGYVYGGYTDDPVSCLQDCDQYVLNTWISRADMPAPARHGAAASTII